MTGFELKYFSIRSYWYITTNPKENHFELLQYVKKVKTNLFFVLIFKVDIPSFNSILGFSDNEEEVWNKK